MSRLALAVALLLAAFHAGAAAASPRSRRPSLALPPGPASPWPSMRHDTDNTACGDIAATHHGDRRRSFANIIDAVATLDGPDVFAVPTRRYVDHSATFTADGPA